MSIMSGSGFRGSVMNKIPDRWLAYSAVGEPIPGTRFIAFKVPLKEELCRKLRPLERFTPSMLRSHCPRLGLVVDLTNTMRYYNRQEFIRHGIDYEKIMCPGKIIPPDDLVDTFFEKVDAYLERNGDSDSLIGVHCTHGLNRTSYFVCSYMIRRMGFEPAAAISAFERARGHTIERLEYLQALYPGASLSAPLPPPPPRAAFPAPAPPPSPPPPPSVLAAPPPAYAPVNGYRPRFNGSGIGPTPEGDRYRCYKMPYQRPYDQKRRGAYQQSPLGDLYGEEPSSSGYGRGRTPAYGVGRPGSRGRGGGGYGERRPPRLERDLKDRGPREKRRPQEDRAPREVRVPREDRDPRLLEAARR